MNLEIFSHDLDALILWHLYNLVDSRSGLSFAHLVIFSASSPLFLMAKQPWWPCWLSCHQEGLSH